MASKNTMSRENSRNVHFSAANFVGFIETPNEDDKSLKWYTNEERDAFKEVLRIDVENARRLHAFLSATGLSWGGDMLHYCVGIEAYMSPEVLRRKMDLKQRHRDAVLDEQDRQDALQICDEALIRRVSELCSGMSKERARRIAVGYWNSEQQKTA